MSVKIQGTTIVATRGDTIKVFVPMRYEDGTEYIPSPEDSIRFALKKDYDDETPIFIKNIPTDTLLLHIEPEDTKNLPQPSTYVYDIQLTYANGDIDTFIDKAKFKLTEEVD